MVLVENTLIYLSIIFTGILVFCFSLNVGAIIKRYRADYQALSSINIDNSVGFNLIYRIIFSPVIIFGLSWAFSFSGAEGVMDKLWIVSVVVALLQMVLLILAAQRVLLVNFKLYAVSIVLSILLSYAVNRYVLAVGFEGLMPDPKSISTEIMIALMAFIYGMLKNISENTADHKARIDRYVRFQKKKILKKYGDLFEGHNKIAINIALSIIIFENYNRPGVIRMVEKYVGAETTDITQTKGVLNDEVGITDLLKRIESCIKANKVTDAQVKEIVAEHNPESKNYSEEVIKIYMSLKKC